MKQRGRATETMRTGGGRMQEGAPKHLKAQGKYAVAYLKLREDIEIPPVLVNFIVYSIAFLLTALLVIALVIVGTL